MRTENDSYWTAFYTKPRNEKKVAERLDAKGFHVYCPVKTVLKQWSDRKKKVKEILFTSYLFALVTESERQEIIQDQGIVSSVFWLNQPVRIPSSEIDAIKNFLNNHPQAEIGQQFQIGKQTSIKSGPFSGEEGVIEKISGSKVTLSLDVLGVTLHAEVPASHLV